MTTINKIILGGVVTISLGVIGTPIVVNTQLEKLVKQEQSLLLKKGFILKEKQNKDNFFKAKREYILTIKDISVLLKSWYPNMSEIDLDNLKKVFDNTKFLLQLNLDKYPVYQKDAIKIRLFKYNNYLNTISQNDEIINQLLTKLQNQLELNVDIDKMDITKITLKDLSLKLANNKDNFLKFELKNNYLTFSDENILNIGSLDFDFEDLSYGQTTIKVDNVVYKYSKKDEFNYDTDLKINYVKYNVKGENFNNKLELNKIAIKNRVNTILHNLSLNDKIDIENIDIHSSDIYRNDSIQIKNFMLNFDISKLYLPSLKTLVSEYSKPDGDSSKIDNSLKTILNKGVVLKINPLSIKEIDINFSDKIKIDKFIVNFSSKLISNNIIPQSEISTINKFLSANLDIKTTQHNIDLITKFNPMVLIYLSQIMTKDKDNNVLINLSYKNGKILSNGKQLF